MEVIKEKAKSNKNKKTPSKSVKETVSVPVFLTKTPVTSAKKPNVSASSGSSSVTNSSAKISTPKLPSSSGKKTDNVAFNESKRRAMEWADNEERKNASASASVSKNDPFSRPTTPYAE